MEKPVLVVMAAGLGSRYGGLKQMDGVGDNGEWLMEFALHDGIKAGFSKVVFIVRQDILDDFKDTIGKKIENHMDCAYVVQKLDDLPKGFKVPKGRSKPWGTAHAVYSARKEVGNAPFMVINADDYYGPQAFKSIYDYLANTQDTDKYYEYCMVGYKLKNTVTEHGHVARGICSVGGDNYLKEITERVRIEKKEDKIYYSEDHGKSWINLPSDTPVSLNCWGFTKSFMDELETELTSFLSGIYKENENTEEFFLPFVVESLINISKARVKVMSSNDVWYGVTYQQDRKKVSHALLMLKEKGAYPKELWK